MIQNRKKSIEHVVANKKQIAILAILETVLLLLILWIFQQYNDYRSFRKYALLIGILLMLMVILVYYFEYIRNTAREIVYGTIALTMCLVFMIVIPVYCVPDEQVHFFKAYQLSNSIMGIDSDVKSITMRAEDAELPIKTEYSNANQLNKYLNAINEKAGDSSLVTTPYFSLGIPGYLYIFPAIGITIGRILGLNSIMLFMMGRLFNAAFFIVSVMWAIKIIPIGKMVIISVSLLPMTLQLMASVSYDVPIIASSFIIIAYTIKVLHGEGMKKIDWIIYALAIAILLPAKSHAYFLIALMPLLGITKYRDKSNEKIKKIILVVCAGLLFSFAVYLCDNVIFYVDRVPGPSQGYSEYYSLKYLFEKPSRLWDIIEGTYRNQFGYYLTTMIGESLGWFNINAPSILTWIGAGLVTVSSLRRKNDPFILDNRQRLILALGSSLTFGFICAGLLFSWTSINSNYIEGVQGRYFLPFLPIVLIIAQTKELEIDSKWDRQLIMAQTIWISIFILSIINRF